MNHLQTRLNEQSNRRNLDPFTAMFYEMDKLFDEFKRGGESPARQNLLAPACDISEQDGAYLIEVDLPGVPQDNVNVEVKGRHLVITADRQRQSKDNQGSGFRYERSFGTYQRTFALPDDVDTEKIEAQYNDGVLNVALPKRQAALAKKIALGQSPKEGSLMSRLFGKSQQSDSDKDVKVTTH